MASETPGNALDMQQLLEALKAYKNGDLSVRLPDGLSGTEGEITQTFNALLDQTGELHRETTAVCSLLGTEGKFGPQADVRGASGIWKEQVDALNGMSRSLTDQLRDIFEVVTRTAQGDIIYKVTADARGEMQEMKNAVNLMVDQYSNFATEITLVCRNLGTEGKFGGQADVQGIEGTWRDVTDSVNKMSSNISQQFREVSEVVNAFAGGDFSRKVTLEGRGEFLELKDTLNSLMDRMNLYASELTRVSRETGTEGRFGGQMEVPGMKSTWQDMVDSTNYLAANLTNQLRNITKIVHNVSNGDLSQKVTVNAEGELLLLKDTVNSMVDQLRLLASEITGVARSLDVDGKFGAQANVPGVSGIWHDITDSINHLSRTLTEQMRDLAAVTTAVANGDLTRKVAASGVGEFLELKTSINTMIDGLNSFVSEITRITREVGTEGRFGGQAEVAGISGTWKDLVANVNVMSARLTDQLRDMANVSRAAVQGDLSRKVTCPASGETQELMEAINHMVGRLSSQSQQSPQN